MPAEDDKRKHLEFVQAVISRMAGNSFAIKGWSITIAAAVIALAAKVENYRFIYAGVFSAILFLLLDAYYLHLERRYRALWETVRQQNAAAVNLIVAIARFAAMAA